MQEILRGAWDMVMALVVSEAGQDRLIVAASVAVAAFTVVVVGAAAVLRAVGKWGVVAMALVAGAVVVARVVVAR